MSDNESHRGKEDNGDKYISDRFLEEDEGVIAAMMTFRETEKAGQGEKI